METTNGEPPKRRRARPKAIPQVNNVRTIASASEAPKSTSVTSETQRPNPSGPPVRPKMITTSTLLDSTHSSRLRPTQSQHRSNRKSPNLASKTAWTTKDTGDLLEIISSDSLKPSTAEVSSKDGFSVLCSYNWQIDGKTILVPGGPPKFIPPSLPVALSPDSGRQYIDQNAFRVPKYPFEPAFQAIALMSPDVQLNDIDIIANRNSLRKLLDLAAGRRQDPFRMGLCMVKNTLFISRNEKRARMMIHGVANSGYGHNLETTFTRPENGLDLSSSHHRVIQYKLGHLNCVVRFEVDAWYENPDRPVTPAAHDPLDDIAATLSRLAVADPPAMTPVKGATLALRKGKAVPSSQLAELKARKAEKIGDAVPQLWFGRTPFLLTGEHVNGVVNRVKITDVSQRWEAWETANQDKLRKLVSVLDQLKRLVCATERREAVVVCEQRGPDVMVFEANEGNGVLPREIVERFWGS